MIIERIKNITIFALIIVLACFTNSAMAVDQAYHSLIRAHVYGDDSATGQWSFGDFTLKFDDDDFSVTSTYSSTGGVWTVDLDAGAGTSVTTTEPVSGIGTAGDPITISGDKGDISVAGGVMTVDDVPSGTVLWDEIGDPGGNQSINFANKTTTFNFTNPAGGWLWNITGAGTSHYLEVNQNTGNPAADTHLLHLEADDKDVELLHLAADMADDASGTDAIALFIDTDDNDDPDFVPLLIQDDSGGTPDDIFKITYDGSWTTGGTGIFTDWDITGTTPTAGYLPYVASRASDVATMGWIDPATIDTTHTLDEAYDDGNTIDYTGAATIADAVILSVVTGEDPIDFLIMSYDGLVSYTFATETDSNIFRIFNAGQDVSHLFGGVAGETVLNDNQEIAGDFLWKSLNHANAILGDAGMDTISVVGTELYIGDADTSTLLLIADGSANYSTFTQGAIAADIAYTLPVDDGDASDLLQSNGSGVLSWVNIAGGLVNEVPYNAGNGTFTTQAGFEYNDGTGLFEVTATIDIDGGNSEIRVGADQGAYDIQTADDMYAGDDITTGDDVFVGDDLDVTGNSTVDGNTISAPVNLAVSNGDNDNVTLPAGTVFTITGPTANFTISGLTGGVAGRIIYIINPSTYDMTMENEEASSTAGNRILTNTGGDWSTTAAGAVTLIYMGDSRWNMISNRA